MSVLTKLMGGASSLMIKPSIAALRKAISAAVGFEVAKYDMICFFENRKINFKVYMDSTYRVYPYDNPEPLFNMIDTLIATELKTGDKVDLLILSHETGEKDSIIMNIGFTDTQNNKQRITKTI